MSPLVCCWLLLTPKNTKPTCQLLAVGMSLTIQLVRFSSLTIPRRHTTGATTTRHLLGTGLDHCLNSIACRIGCCNSNNRCGNTKKLMRGFFPGLRNLPNQPKTRTFGACPLQPSRDGEDPASEPYHQPQSQTGMILMSAIEPRLEFVQLKPSRQCRDDPVVETTADRIGKRGIRE